MAHERARPRRVLVGGVVGALMVLATGCASAPPQPSTLPTPTRAGTTSDATRSAHASQSPSPRPSRTPARPTPRHARPNGPDTSPPASGSQIDGARAALTAFLIGLDTASGRADTSTVDGQWQSTCLWCNTYLQGIDFVHSAAGYTRSGGRIEAGPVRYLGTGGDGQLLFHVRMSMSAVRVRDGQGHRLAMFSLPAAHSATYTFGLRRIERRWQVVQGVRGKTIQETQPDQPTPHPTKKHKQLGKPRQQGA